MNKKYVKKVEHNSRGLKNFTILELLIVISIIVILVAVLMPALNKARSTAKAINCVSNQKQIGIAIGLYGDSNNQYFYCPNTISASESSESVMWSVRLKIDGYLSNYSAVFCTENPSASPRYSYGAYYSTNPVSFKRSNYQKAGYSKIALLGCSWTVENQTPLFRMIFYNDITSETYGRPYLVHGKKCNMLFMDGHAAGRKYEQMSQEYNLMISGDTARPNNIAALKETYLQF